MEEENNLTEKTLLDIIDKAFIQGIVSKKLVDNIRLNHPKLPTFYLIPKLHKNALDPPGRPIVSDSSHPPSIIRGIPIGQYLRAKRICSNEENFNKQAIDLTGRFLDRGYSKRAIKRGYQRAAKASRDQLLYRTSRSTTRENNNQVRFISTFNKEWKNLKDIVYKHWEVLMVDPILRGMLPTQPSIVARRSANLKDLLVHSHYESTRTANKQVNQKELPGLFPCGLCKGCYNHNKSTTFKNWNGSRTYTIRQYLTCASVGVIYHATCPCGEVYIGLTTRELKFFMAI
ncbi:uncharacterized protein LOC143768136 [Ranitomeya variabilis]|uniref:uncharacterized protein LOC143768136 n=1 Tax=Ranitomeya variabilis TaxID=490064 RepID=UPI0040578AB5